jgi:AmmeMemoRadiSam system protein B/AmmeMemoRadiSam system protein A
VRLPISTKSTTRECAVSGTFYSSDKESLKKELLELFSKTREFEKKDVKAIIVPHAGYIFSAKTAAVAYKTLNSSYKNVFIIGSSHHIDIDATSIYNLGNYKTPMGEVNVNNTIVDELMKNHELFKHDPNAHAKEHTLEVQLPFLQTLYKDKLNIIPIIVATNNFDTIKKIAKSLKPYFEDKDNLFVISTDLSHYPSYEDANKVDIKTLQAIETNNSQTFIDTMIAHENLSLKNFHTSACGWSSVLTLMELTNSKKYRYEVLAYMNSGDIKDANRDKVVGYGAIRIFQTDDEFHLSDDEKKELLYISKLALEEAVINQKRVQLDKNKISKKLKNSLGAFVTLYKNGELRGCIGRFEPDQPLYEVIIDTSISAAFHDNRFTQVTKDELKDITIEISVLTPRKQIYSIDDVIIPKHGIYVEQGTKTGTYLPHVAKQMNWNATEFVQSCVVDKAKIDPKDFDDVKLYIYEALVF